MSERPILFNGAMVRAVLDDRKTQTRRQIFRKEDTSGSVKFAGWLDFWKRGSFATFIDSTTGNAVQRKVRCPFGAPGDTLRVREAWTTESRFDGVKPSRLPKTARIHYMANGSKPAWAGRGRPSIFLPTWASRLTLEVVSVRVERLQDISEADAVAEGIERSAGGWNYGNVACRHFPTARDAYWSLWDSINGAGAWASSPWVWVVEFRRLP